MNKIEFIKTDYKNRFNRKLWLEDRRRDLTHYFDVRNMNYGSFDSEPFWSIIPRTTIWQIRSLGTPGFDGWYGIAGDHPTDIVPLNYFDGDPRKILDHFATKWLRASERLKQGEDYGDFRIEHIEERPTIGELVEDRAMRIKRWVEADELWSSEFHTVTPIIPQTPKSDID